MVTIDYFTKWIETEPLANTKEEKIEDFMWENILYKLAVPWVFIMYIGPQFNYRMVKDFCNKWNIFPAFAAAAHP